MEDKYICNLLVGKLLKKGERAKAEKVFFDCLKELEMLDGSSKKGLQVFLESIDYILPLVEIKSKKVGGTVYRIPIEVSYKRSLSLGVNWLLDSVRKEKGKLAKKLANELYLAKQGQGKTVERIRELHVFAQKNRGLVKFL